MIKLEGRTRTLSIFFILLFAFLALRMLPVFTAVERISHYDELETGAIAKDWMRGARLPLWHYQLDPYGGESLVLAALAVPFFKIMGATLLAVKMPTILFAILTFILTFLFLRRYFGENRAIEGSLLLICAPASFVQLSLSGLTGHTESLAFNVAALYFFYSFLQKDRKDSSAFLFGLFSGLGFWMYHETGIMTTACVLSWALIDRKSLLGRSGLLAAGGLSLGALPWLIYNFYYGPSGFSAGLSKFFWAVRTPFYYQALIKKIFYFFGAGLPFSFCFFPVLGIPERIFSVVYFLACFCPVMYQAARNAMQHERKVLPFLVFLPLFAVVFLLSPYDINYGIGYVGYRYLAPLIFFTLVLAAVLPAPEKIRRIFFAVMLSLGLLSQTGIMFREPFNRASTYRGVSYYYVGPQWFLTLPPAVRTPAALSREMFARDAVSNYFLTWGIADTASAYQSPFFIAGVSAFAGPSSMAPLPGFPTQPFRYEWAGSIQKDTASFGRHFHDVPEGSKKYFYKGFLENQTEILMTDCPNCMTNLARNSEWAWRAAGRYFYLEMESREKLGVVPDEAVNEALRKLEEAALDPEPKKLLYQGFAMGTLRAGKDSNILLNPTTKKIISRLPIDSQAPFFHGLGWVARAMYREDRRRAMDVLQEFPEPMKQAARTGFTDFERWYNVPRQALSGRLDG